MPLLLGTIVGFSLKNNYSYIESLNRRLIVPSFVFVLVWSVLYVLMGIWIYLYEKKYQEEKVIPVIFWISVFVNLCFNPTLFLLHNLLLSFIDVCILLGLIVFLFVKTLRNKDKFSYLLIPYILWLIVALTLIVDLLMLN